MDFLLRTRFKNEIVAEFLPPRRKRKSDRVIILCDGMPGVPGKDALAHFLSSKGYWVIYPRYRGSWESGGVFLEKSPVEDVLEIVSELPKGLRERSFGRLFRLHPQQIFVIGGSFGGPAAILSTLDPRITRAVAVCPVVDWKAAAASEGAETSNPDYADFLKDAFGEAYRFPKRNWKKLSSGRFYSPVFEADKVSGDKLLLFHAKDDPVIPFRDVQNFAEKTGARLVLSARGGHLSSTRTVQAHWEKIRKFFESTS